MPARIVIVHDDTAFTQGLMERFGRDAALFTDPIKALAVLEQARAIEFLICRIQFADRQPVGLSLARVVRKVRPDVRVIFTGDPDYRYHARGLGEFVPEPVAAAYVAMIVEWLT
jgi:ActR/RegA family two-component response regulator